MNGGAEVDAALDRRLLPSTQAPIALAFSGGGDSLALLLMAKTWADAHGRRLLALTVDHGLNPDSARWTAFAREAATRAGIEWRPLRWEGDKPQTGLPAAARAARHRLLAEAARHAGAEVVLMGHTLDDRRESALMRERDAPGIGSLREWAPSPAWPDGRGVFVLRPLLEVSRAELRNFLSGQGWAWLDDPANDDPRYARVRARRRLSQTIPEEIDDAEPGQTVPDHSCTTDGRVIARRRGLSRRFVAAALLCASGTDDPPRGERLERLMERLEGAGAFTASLAGARVTAEGDTVEFGREAGERARGGLAPVSLAPARAAVWDGRFEVTADAEGLSVEALVGRVGALTRAERTWLKTLPPAARSALPVVVGERLVALPRPFGDGPAAVVCLVAGRLDAACGRISREGQRPS